MPRNMQAITAFVGKLSVKAIQKNKNASRKKHMPVFKSTSVFRLLHPVDTAIPLGWLHIFVKYSKICEVLEDL